MGDDRFESLDGLFEIFNVPFVVIGAAEEEPRVCRQEIVSKDFVNALSIGIWPTDENSLTASDEIG